MDTQKLKTELLVGEGFQFSRLAMFQVITLK